MMARKGLLIALIASVLALFSFTGCASSLKIQSITYTAYDSSHTVSYVLSHLDKQDADVLSITISSQGDQASSTTGRVQNGSLEEAFALCSGYTTWDKNPGDIDTRQGELILGFDDGSQQAFAVTQPLVGEGALGQADKCAAYITELAKNAKWD